MEGLFNKYQSRGVVFIALSNESGSTVSPFVQNNGIHYPVGFGSNSYTTYGVSSIPAFFVVDRAGKVTFRSTGLDAVALEAAIIAALDVPPPQAAAPTFTPSEGVYDSPPSVRLSCATIGAVIYYTTDGSTPSASSTPYSSPIEVTAAVTIKALAVKAGMTDSAVVSARYTLQTAAPSFSPPGGVYAAGLSVQLSCGTAGAVIYYTIDGSQPSPSATRYTSPVALWANTTFKALAVKPGLADSPVASAVYTIQTATPSFFPPAGTYASPQSITLSCATVGASLFYTLDGTPPSSLSKAYSGPFEISGLTMVQAIALKPDMADSPVASATYTIQVAGPEFDPPGGDYDSAQSVTLSCATSGAIIYYTTDGSEPTLSAPRYASPVKVTETVTLKAMAVKAGLAASPISAARYTLSSRTKTDTDGDGFPDEVEEALGSSATSASSIPFGGPSSLSPLPLSLVKLKIRLFFDKGGSAGGEGLDSMQLSGALPIPAGFTMDGQRVVMDVGGVIRVFTLDPKGNSTPRGNDSFKLRLKQKSGQVAAQNAKFSAKLSKGFFSGLLEDEGLSGAVDVKGVSKTVPVVILFGERILSADQPQSFTAKAGKAGKT